MQIESADEYLRKRVFEFFFWFSKFEFALKERRILKSEKRGSKAEADWDKFTERYQRRYSFDVAGRALVDLNPKRQIVGEHGLEFESLTFRGQDSELYRVVKLLKTVRNNLFHGGKHSASGWDDPARITLLLTSAIAVLHKLAELGDFGPDYTGMY